MQANGMGLTNDQGMLLSLVSLLLPLLSCCRVLAARPTPAWRTAAPCCAPPSASLWRLVSAARCLAHPSITRVLVASVSFPAGSLLAPLASPFFMP